LESAGGGSEKRVVWHASPRKKISGDAFDTSKRASAKEDINSDRIHRKIKRKTLHSMRKVKKKLTMILPWRESYTVIWTREKSKKESEGGVVVSQSMNNYLKSRLLPIMISLSRVDPLLEK